MSASYGTLNNNNHHNVGGKHNSNNKVKHKEEKRPLLVEDSQSDWADTTPDTILDLSKPINNGNSKKMDEYNPLLHRKLEHPTTNLDTMVHLLKGNIGTGILAMPDAFRNAGWLVGFFGTLFMGAICTHCMHMLVGCSHELCKRTQSPALSFSEVTDAAFRTGPVRLRKFASVMKTLINVFLCVTQIGFCCVYFVFVAANVHDIVKYYYADISLHWYLCMFLLPIIFLNWLKNLKYLTPVSLIAAFLTVGALAITFHYTLEDLPKIATRNAFATWSQLPLYFGTAIYAFEGIGVILPLENNMRTPQDFSGLTGVLNTGMVIVTCLYTAVGFYGYLKYGDLAVQGSITLYLPAGATMAQLARLAMAIAILFSYCLQFYVPFNIIWPGIKRRLSTEKAQCIGEYVTRTLLVIVSFALAIAVPNLGAIISLIGAFSSSAIALIFPPVIEIITFWPNKLGRGNWVLWKDLLIILFGVSGFVVGSYVSLLNIFNPQHHPDA